MGLTDRKGAKARPLSTLFRGIIKRSKEHRHEPLLSTSTTTSVDQFKHRSKSTADLAAAYQPATPPEARESELFPSKKLTSFMHHPPGAPPQILSAADQCSFPASPPLPFRHTHTVKSMHSLHCIANEPVILHASTPQIPKSNTDYFCCAQEKSDEDTDDDIPLAVSVLGGRTKYTHLLLDENGNEEDDDRDLMPIALLKNNDPTCPQQRTYLSAAEKYKEKVKKHYHL